MLKGMWTERRFRLALKPEYSLPALKTDTFGHSAGYLIKHRHHWLQNLHKVQSILTYRPKSLPIPIIIIVSSRLVLKGKATKVDVSGSTCARNRRKGQTCLQLSQLKYSQKIIQES